MKNRSLVSILLTVLCGCIWCSSPASAATPTTEFHYSESFYYGKEVNAIAIDSSSGASAGDVYVVGFHLGVMKFNPAHELQETLPGTTLEVFGVSVDQSTGDVYVADFGADTVDRFSAAGVMQSQCSVGGKPTSVAVEEATSDIYVMLSETRVVEKLNSSCEAQLIINGTPGGSFGEAMFGGVAVDQTTGDVYIGDSVNAVVDKFNSSGTYLLQFGGNESKEKSFKTAPAKLDIAIDQPTGNVYVADTLHHVIDEFDSAGLFLVEFNGAETQSRVFEKPRAVAVDGATGDVYVGDSNDASGLNPEHEVVDVFKVTRPHNITTGSASNVGPTSATLNGTVNPSGTQPVSCEFEYGTGLAYGQSAPCAQTPGEIGAGEAPVPVSADITGLTPGVTYHFRLATDTGRGEDEDFITPVAPVIADEGVTDVASTSAVFSARIDPGGGDTGYYFEYGPDLSYGTTVPVPDGDAGSGINYVSVSAYPQALMPSSAYHFRVVAVNVAGTTYGPDQVFITQPAGGPLLLPDGRMWELVSPPNKNGALIYTSGEGGGGGAALQAATDGEAISYSSFGTMGEGASGNAEVTQVLSRRGNGRWSSQDISTPHAQPKGATFVPEYHFFSFDLSSAIVVPLDEPPLAPGGVHDSAYVRDNGSGTFSLLNESLEAWYAAQYQWLKEWYSNQVAPGQTPLSCEAGAAPTDGGTVLDTSYDGCEVYFVSTAILAAGASLGTNNLYAAHEETGAWTTTFVATLSSEDERDWIVGSQAQGTASRVSPNGRYLAFMSNRSLTGYDNTDASSGQPDEEVFLYDSSTGSLVCTSCDPTGARPEGVRVAEKGSGFTENPGPMVDFLRAWENHWLAGSLTAARKTRGFPAYYQPRSLSDSGRLFFDSPEPLVPQDANGKEDVYEYEPLGAGSCDSSDTTFSATLKGCVSLISSGLSSGESAFLDASVSGADVFFLTKERLTSQDYDTSLDVYDTHVCSSKSPCFSSPSESLECNTSDSCKPAPLPQPSVFGAPASATFSGEGNVVEAVKEGRPRVSTSKMKLARALKACRKKPRRKRHACEVRAKMRYGAQKIARRHVAGGK